MKVSSAVESSLSHHHPIQKSDYPLHSTIKKINYLTKELETSINKHKKDLNRQNIEGNTPLHIAAELGNLIAVKLLIKEGALINIKNSNGENPLQIVNRQCKNIRVLHKQKPFQDIGKFLKNQPFEVLLEKGKEQEKITKLHSLLKQGFNVNCKNTDGNTLLHIAIDKNFKGIVKFLVEHKAKLNIPNKLSKTSLQIAEKKGKEIFEYLQTGFHRAIDNEQSVEVFFDLIEQGFDVNAKDQQNNSPLFLAIDNGNLEYVKWFVDSGADLSLLKEGRTPLEHATYLAQQKNSYEHEQIEEFLSLPLLHLAILLKKNKEYLSEIIDADPKTLTTKDREGNTPWHVASNTAHMDALQLLLLKTPTTANNRNNKGDIPFDYFQQKGSMLVSESKKQVLQFFLNNEKIQPLWKVKREIFFKEKKNESLPQRLNEIKEKIKSEKDLSILKQLQDEQESVISQIKENESIINVLKVNHNLYYYDPIFFAKNCLEKFSFSLVYKVAKFLQANPLNCLENIPQTMKHFSFNNPAFSIGAFNFSIGAWIATSSAINTFMQARLKMHFFARDIISATLAGAIVFPLAHFFGEVNMEETGLFALKILTAQFTWKSTMSTIKLAKHQFTNFGNWVYEKAFESDEPETPLVITRN